MASMSELPIDLIYQHILPYADFKTIYGMRKDNQIPESVYEEAVFSRDPIDIALVAVEFDDDYLLSIIIDDITYTTAHDICYIVKNMRSLKCFDYLLNNYFFHDAIVKDILRDVELVSLLSQDSRFSSLIRQIGEEQFQSDNSVLDEEDTCEDMENYVYALEDQESYASAVKMIDILSLAISICMIFGIDKVRHLMRKRSKMIDIVVDKGKKIESFSKIRSLYVYDLGDRSYSKKEVYDRRMMSVSWYRKNMEMHD